MSKKQIFSKSLQANKRLVNSLTKEQLDDLMKVFDDYEVEQCDIHGVTQQRELFAFEDGKEFKEWQKKQGITRIGDSRYKWNDFEYDRRFFLEKYLEYRNKANCG